MTMFSSEISGWTFSHMLGLISSSKYCARNKNDSCFPLRGSLFCKDLSMTLLRDLFIRREVLTIIKHLASRLDDSELWSIRGPPPPGEEKDGDGPGIRWSESKSSHSVKFTFQSKVLGFISESVRDHKHGYHQPQQREMRLNWMFTQRDEKSSRAVCLPVGRPELGHGWLGLKSTQSTEQHLVWQCRHWKS